VGRTDLFLRQGKVVDLRFENIPVNPGNAKKSADPFAKNRIIEEDKQLLSLLTPYTQEADHMLSAVIGRATGTFSNRKTRIRETPLGDLIADAMQWYCTGKNVDFAFQNGGGIRAPIFKGDITRKSLYEVLPFENTLIILTLKGSDILRLFEQMSGLGGKGHGGFLQVSKGIELTLAGKKVKQVMIRGRELDIDRIYRVATNSFLASGGDGYHMLKQAIDSYDTSLPLREVLEKYIISKGGRISPRLEKRICFSD
jgi:5'-nucleotidase/UDP-sugar diphosphatase